MRKINNKILLFLIGLICLIPAVLPFFDSRMPTFHDETQLANLHQYHKAISLGQFPPRWAPDMHFQYGSPFPEFNYQIPYYLTYSLSNLGLSLTWSFKLVMVSSLFLGFIGFYLLSLEFAAAPIALMGALVYSLAPYRAVNLFVRGTLGESFAFAVFPFVLLFLFKLVKKPSVVNFLLASIFTAILVLTHQPATILVLPFIYLTALGYSFISRNFKSLFLQLLSGLGALLLSAYYWLPVIFEKQFLSKTSPFNFYDHFPFIKQLIYSPWGYGSSNWGPYDDMSFQMGIINLLFIAVSIVTLFIIVKKSSSKTKLVPVISLSLVSVFGALFLMNIRSSFFWNVFPFTQEIQFPWRILMVTTLFTPLLGVLSLTALSPKPRMVKYVVLGISALSIAMGFYFFQPGDLFSHDDNYYLRRFLPTEVLEQGEIVSTPYLNHSEDYAVLPKNSVRPISLPLSKVTSLMPDTKIDVDYSNPFDFTARIENTTGDKLTIHNFYFPGWFVYLDDDLVPVTLNYYGAMTLEVVSGVHELRVEFANTPVRSISNIISVGSWIFILAFLCLEIAQKRGKRTT